MDKLKVVIISLMLLEKRFLKETGKKKLGFFGLKFSKLTAPIALIGITAADQYVLWSEVHTKSRNCEC